MPPVQKKESLDRVCEVLWNLARGRSSDVCGRDWSEVDEEIRVSFAVALVPLFGVTRCGCRTCRRATFLAGELCITGELVAEALKREAARQKPELN